MSRRVAVRQKRWRCIICGFVYDERLGLPHEGIAPGTAWADIPESWTCPDCGVRKVDFSMVALPESD
ncbi:rubredoxin [Sorangium sp. So ce406]|uniref:rubredoxin n=1 Tax=Sorangium sp. So ce406 TaxID=3133311 RepID=UPI003F5C4002